MEDSQAQPQVAPAADSAAAGSVEVTAVPEPQAGTLPELPLFSCKEAYVYRVPPATTVGHRAELWDVNKWLATVSLRVVQADDDAFVRLLEEKTGELFAECPVPTDKPLLTAVEPVIDSSRYFVLRIVDRESGHHAFIGVGFRDRSEASDFNAALHEFLQYIRRKRTAEAMRHAYEERLQAAAAESAAIGEQLAAGPLADYSIKEGETLTLRINAPKPVSGGFVSGAARKGTLGKSFSLLMDGHGGAVAALSPPPGSSPKLAMCVSPSLEAGGGSPLHSGQLGGRMPHARLSGSGEANLHNRLTGLQLQEQQAQAAQQHQLPPQPPQQQGQGQGQQGEAPASCSASVTSASTAAGGGGAEDFGDDDFGDFAEAPAQPSPKEGGTAEEEPAAVQARG